MMMTVARAQNIRTRYAARFPGPPPLGFRRTAIPVAEDRRGPKERRMFKSKAARGRDRRGTVSAALLASILCVASPAAATHNWSTYHWEQPKYKSLVLGDNVDAKWDAYLKGAPSGWKNAKDAWNAEGHFDLTVGAGQTTPRRCRPVSGRVEVCNYKYGNNGWLGIAQIWLSGGHITQAVTKLNDTYFLTAKYNTPHWRSLVMCQEIGHNLGLGHQDEDFGNGDLPTDSVEGETGTQTCMDYTNKPAGNEEPNAHDFGQLTEIYFHSHSSETSTQVSAGSTSQLEGGNSAAEWGKAVSFSKDGKPHVYVKDLGSGRRLITDVFWIR